MSRRSILGMVVVAAGLAAVNLPAAFAAETLPPLRERIAAESHEVPKFRRHVVPLLGKLGCNGRACHGSFQGQGGFRLSLFGYDFKMDHENLTQGEEPRADVEMPEVSLMLLKPTLEMPHKGGKRMEAGGWEYTALLRWIGDGAKGLDQKEADLVRVEVTPREIVSSEQGQKFPLRAVAVWSDGTREDVTDLCRFSSNDDQIATVDPSGVVTTGDRGDTHVVVFYDNGVVPVPVLRPVSDRTGPNYPVVEAPTEIDRLVVNKLKKLGIVQSELCTDAEFLRRVSVDITGSLPTAKEVEAFLADSSLDKRARKVDELLERPTYAAWWTTRLCDMTGNNDDALVNITPLRPQASQDWYDWIYRRVAENQPYDELVAGIVLAVSRKHGQPYLEYSKELSDLYRPKSKLSYADRDSLTHFWARRTVRQPAQKALSFAHSFLGIRIQCAECHKHPFDQWTQDDYKQFTRFFDRVSYGINPESRKDYAALVGELGMEEKKGNDLRREFPKLLADGKTIPFEEVYVNRPKKAPAAPPQQPNKQQKKAAKAKAAAAAKAAKESKSPVVALKPGEQPKPPAKVAAQPLQNNKQGKNAVVPAVPARLLGAKEIDLSKFDDPRTPLMEWLRDPENPYFARAFVNRVWSSYFEVGIVEPADDLSLANPPSNAELLDYLAKGFIEHNFDMKWLHREIANSRTYQLSWKPNETNRLDRRNFSRAVPRRLPAEVAYDAVRQAGASDERAAMMQTDPKGRAITIPGTGRRANNGTASYALTVFGRSTRESNCDCDRSTEPTLLQTVYLRNDRDVLTLLDNSSEGWLDQVAETLFPAQRSAGKGAQANAKRAAQNAKKEAAEQKNAKTGAGDPAAAAAATKQQIERLRTRLAELEKADKTQAAAKVKERLAALEKQAAKQDSAAAKDKPANAQPANDGKKAQKKALKKKMEAEAAQAAAPQPRKAYPKVSGEQAVELVEQAYLRTLSRYPDTDELARARRHLDESPDAIAGLRDLLWALLNTKEFIVNH